jgi:hypothetical protein
LSEIKGFALARVEHTVSALKALRVDMMGRILADGFKAEDSKTLDLPVDRLLESRHFFAELT